MVKYFCDVCGKEITEGKAYAPDSYRFSTAIIGASTQKDDYPNSFDACGECRNKIMNFIFHK